MKALPFALVLGTQALLGCVVAEPAPAEGEEACGASSLQGLIGQPEGVLATMRFSQVLRVIGPGMAVTMDYSPDRLNIDVGEDGLITRLWCG